jgi:anti-sigma factor RsiW
MNTKLDPDLLHAWFDNELSVEQRAEVEAWLREHPEEAAQVRLWAADAQAVRARLEPVLAEPVPQRLTQLVWNRAPATVGSGWPRWAAAVALFVLGGTSGAVLMWTLQPQAARTLAGAGAAFGCGSRFPERSARTALVKTSSSSSSASRGSVASGSKTGGSSLQPPL